MLPNAKHTPLYRLFNFSKNRQKAVEIASSYKKIFEGDYAKNVLADLAEYCHVWTVDNIDLSNAYKTAFNEGKRSVFLHIAAMLNLNNKDFNEFFEESAKRLQARDNNIS